MCRIRNQLRERLSDAASYRVMQFGQIKANSHPDEHWRSHNVHPL